MTERNFRSHYYEKVGFRGVEEKRSLDKLLAETPCIDSEKLQHFCLRFTVPDIYRSSVWRILLGVLPVYRNSQDLVWQQRCLHFNDLYTALQLTGKLRRRKYLPTNVDTSVGISDPDDHHRNESLTLAWLLNQNRLKFDVVRQLAEADCQNFKMVVASLRKVLPELSSTGVSNSGSNEIQPTSLPPGLVSPAVGKKVTSSSNSSNTSTNDSPSTSTNSDIISTNSNSIGASNISGASFNSSDVEVFWIGQQMFAFLAGQSTDQIAIGEALGHLIKDDTDLVSHLKSHQLLEHIAGSMVFATGFATVFQPHLLARLWDKVIGGRSFKVLIYTYAAFLYVFRAEVVKTTCAVDIDAMLTGMPESQQEVVLSHAIDVWEQDGLPLIYNPPHHHLQQPSQTAVIDTTATSTTTKSSSQPQQPVVLVAGAGGAAEEQPPMQVADEHLATLFEHRLSREIQVNM